MRDINRIDESPALGSGHAKSGVRAAGPHDPCLRRGHQLLRNGLRVNSGARRRVLISMLRLDLLASTSPEENVTVVWRAAFEWRKKHETICSRPCAVRFRSFFHSGPGDLFNQGSGKDGKPLAGAALKSFMTKCTKDTCEPKAVDKNGKPLAGAAKASFMKKCESEA